MITVEAASEYIKNGEITALRTALEQQPELARATTVMGVSLLQFAAYCGRREAIAVLRPFSEPLRFFEAASIGAKDAVLERLQADPGLLNAPGPDGFTGLGLACFFGHQEIVASLLEQNADPNVPAANAIGVYPIHSACAVSHHEIAKLLLAAGANPNVKQQRDITPLHSAAHNGQQKLAELLLSFRADIAATTTEGLRPADMAEEAGFPELAKRLRP